MKLPDRPDKWERAWTAIRNACAGIRWSAGTAVFRCIASVAFCLSAIAGAPDTCAGEAGDADVCRPQLEKAANIDLGKAGIFRWSCPGKAVSGNGFYIVFIRPQGTYVLLKVPENRTFFEFTPDQPGRWRWIVITTDPDRSKPDLESEPGFFEVGQQDAPSQ
jgi:hypothetical protein